MGIIRSTFNFLMGTGFGIYLAQNYNVPDIHKFYTTGKVIADQIEKNYRKPKNRKDED